MKKADDLKNTHESSNIKNYYEILNLEKNASAKDVREAYYRLKNTYSDGNQALYSLMGEDDIDDSMGDILEAYQILVTSESRLKYDQKLIDSGLVGRKELRRDLHEESSQRLQGAVSYRDENSDEVRLRKPRRKNDPGSQVVKNWKEKSIARYKDINQDEQEYSDHAIVSEIFETKNITRKISAPDATKQEVQEKVKELIADGDPSDGVLYKKIRQLVGVSKEEMQDHIKISIGYIEHLEANKFELLPQAIYVKGFMRSYLRFLGVEEYDRLVKAYLERMKDWQAKKKS